MATLAAPKAAAANQAQTHQRFTTGLGVILATLGSAVGLGNIWKFPYLVGDDGDTAFVIVYLLSNLRA